jgi:two-component system, LytTR family, response regulator
MMPAIELPEPQKISYLRSEINYTIFCLSDGSEMVVSYTLKRFENHADFAGFWRVSQSFLLNPAYVIKHIRDGKKNIIVLQNGHRIQVSRRKAGLVKELFDMSKNK